MKIKIISLALALAVALCSLVAVSENKTVYALRRARIYTSARESDTVTVVYADYPLIVVGSEGSYYKVEDINGAFSGYIKKSLTGEGETRPFEVADEYKTSYKRNTSSTIIPKSVKSSRYTLSGNMDLSAHKEYVVYLAECKVGCLYDRYGDGARTFNNVSLVEYVLGTMGYSVENDVYSVGHKGAQSYVIRRDLQKGDIVCFATDNDSSTTDHIGVYIGQGYFVHCSPVAGCVLVSYLDSGFYSKAFLYGRRYLG